MLSTFKTPENQDEPNTVLQSNFQMFVLVISTAMLTTYIRFFYGQHFYQQRQAEIDKKSSKC